jgi:hypothetical protein
MHQSILSKTEQFMIACKQGDFDKIKFLIKETEIKLEHIIECIEHNHEKIAIYLVRDALTLEQKIENLNSFIINRQFGAFEYFVELMSFHEIKEFFIHLTLNLSLDTNIPYKFIFILRKKINTFCPNIISLSDLRHYNDCLETCIDMFINENYLNTNYLNEYLSSIFNLFILGANPDIRNTLEIAIRYDNEILIKTFVLLGVNIIKENKRWLRESPLKIACSKSILIVNFLTNYEVRKQNYELQKCEKCNRFNKDCKCKIIQVDKN